MSTIQHPDATKVCEQVKQQLPLIRKKLNTNFNAKSAWPLYNFRRGIKDPLIKDPLYEYCDKVCPEVENKRRGSFQGMPAIMFAEYSLYRYCDKLCQKAKSENTQVPDDAINAVYYGTLLPLLDQLDGEDDNDYEFELSSPGVELLPCAELLMRAKQAECFDTTQLVGIGDLFDFIKSLISSVTIDDML
jgi:hypothetical protein